MNKVIGGLNVDELNRRYEGLLMHNNILGCYAPNVNLRPILDSSVSSSQSTEEGNPLKIGEYTITPSLQSFTNEDFERIVNRGKVKSFQFRELRNLKICDVIKRVEKEHASRNIAGIEFCRWLVEDAGNAPEKIQKKLPQWRGCDAWLYFLGTSVRQMNGGWHVLAARLDGTGFHQEIMWLETSWRKGDSHDAVVLYVE